MQRFYRACRILTFVFLGLYTFFQTMLVIATFYNKSSRVMPYWLYATLMLTVTVVMLASVILFFVLKRKRSLAFLGTVLAVIGGVVLAVMMPSVFPTAYDLNGTQLGVTWWTAIMRHLVPPVVMALCLLPLWLEYHREYRAEKDFDAGKDTPSYFDEFKDGYKMRVLDEEYEKSTKEKRSVRNRKRKESDKG